MNNRFKHIAFWIIIAGLFAPLLQNVFHYDYKTLVGYVEQVEKPTLSADTWFEGTWQEDMSKYCESAIGLRPYFVRTRNQLEYALFRNTTSHVIIGKEDWLYEAPYINSWKGKDAISDADMKALVDRIQFVASNLKQQQTELIVLIAPNKAMLLPQYLPEKYMTKPVAENNYTRLKEGLTRQGVHCIDYNTVMQQYLQTNDTKPVYGKYGVHWTYYAGVLAVDTMVRYMEHIKGVDITDIHMDSLERVHTGKYNDIDLLNLLNLAWKPQDQLYVYPVLRYDSANKYKPDILALADSYHDGISCLGVLDQVFRRNELWYYDTLEKINGEMIPMDPQIDILQRIAGKDYIVVLYTDQNIPRLQNGFFVKMEAAFRSRKASSSTGSR